MVTVKDIQETPSRKETDIMDIPDPTDTFTFPTKIEMFPISVITFPVSRVIGLPPTPTVPPTPALVLVEVAMPSDVVVSRLPRLFTIVVEVCVTEIPGLTVDVGPAVEVVIDEPGCYTRNPWVSEAQSRQINDIRRR